MMPTAPQPFAAGDQDSRGSLRKQTLNRGFLRVPDQRDIRADSVPEAAFRKCHCQTFRYIAAGTSNSALPKPHQSLVHSCFLLQQVRVLPRRMSPQGAKDDLRKFR